MLRVLFVIAAVVAVALALVIDQPLLFWVAGAALGVALTMAIMHVVRRRLRRKRYKQSSGDKAESLADAAPEAFADEEALGDERQKDLAAVGILGIRPKGAAGGDGEYEEGLGTDAVSGNGSPATAANGAPHAASKVSRLAAPVQGTLDFSIQESSQSVRIAVNESSHQSLREVLLPYMQAYRGVTRADTVCLLRQPNRAPQYHIEAIVSVNRNARGSGSFVSKTPLLQWERRRSGLHMLSADKNQLAGNVCGYYRQRVPIKQVVLAPVPVPSALARYVLLADAMREHMLRSEAKQILSLNFAHLLGNILETGISDELLREAKEDARPRSEIVDEEIWRAQDQGTSLALALVYLNCAEDIADEGGQRAVMQAESLLVQRLRETVRGARVERFGELLFGVFFKEAGEAVEQWAIRLQQDMLADSRLPGGGAVSIGIAVLDDGNASAEALRGEATQALREAFATGMPTIVG